MKNKIVTLALLLSIGAFASGCDSQEIVEESSSTGAQSSVEASESKEQETTEAVSEETEQVSTEETTSEVETTSEEVSKAPEAKEPQVVTERVELTKKDVEAMIPEIMELAYTGKTEELLKNTPDGIIDMALEFYEDLGDGEMESFELKSLEYITVYNINDPEELQALFVDEYIAFEEAFPKEEDYRKIEAIATAGYYIEYIEDGEYEDWETYEEEPIFTFFYEDGEWKYLYNEDLGEALIEFHLNYDLENIVGGEYDPTSVIILDDSLPEGFELVSYEEGKEKLGLTKDYSLKGRVVEPNPELYLEMDKFIEYSVYDKEAEAKGIYSYERVFASDLRDDEAEARFISDCFGQEEMLLLENETYDMAQEQCLDNYYLTPYLFGMEKKSVIVSFESIDNEDDVFAIIFTRR